jgi:hypothetical protein
MTTVPFHISPSDMSAFLSCRYKWDLSSPNRQSLRHRSSPRFYLTAGTALHAAIQTMADGYWTLTDPVSVAKEVIDKERDAKIEAYRHEYGFKPWAQELEQFETDAEFTLDLVSQYFEQYPAGHELEDQGLTYVATEVPFKIDITAALENPRRQVYFVGTIDGVAVDNDDRLFIVENKSYSQKPEVDDLMFHFQSTGYAVAIEMLTGQSIAGGLYNGVAKKLIKPPKVLKGGKLSVDKRQSTTTKEFLKACRATGQNPNHPDYAGFIKFLQDREEQGDTRFFYREKFFYNEDQKKSWITDFYEVANEMVGDPRIYRTIPYNGCGKQGSDCWYADVCRSAHSGGDVDYILDKRYVVGSYGTFEEVQGIEPTSVNSMQEFKDLLQKNRQFDNVDDMFAYLNGTLDE